MFVSIKRTNELTDVEKREWDALESADSKGSFYSSNGWMEVINSTDSNPQKVALVYEQYELLGGVIFDVNEEDSDNHYNIKSILTDYNCYYNVEFPKDIIRDQNLFPANTITLRAATSCDFRYKKNLPTQVINMMIDLIIQELSKLGNSVSFLYVPKDIKYLREYLLMNDYWEIPLGARYYMPAMSKEEYLGIFNCDKRAKIKKEIHKLKKYNLEIVEVECNSYNLEYFVDCLKQNFEKHGFNHFGFEFAYNRTKKIINEVGIENVYFHELRHDGEKVGISMHFINKQVLHAYQIGFEYKKLCREWSSYFQLAFYNSVFLSKKFNDIKYVQIYDGLDETKLSRGFIPEILYAYIKKDPNLFNPEEVQTLSNNIRNILNQLIGKYSKHIKRLGDFTNDI